VTKKTLEFGKYVKLKREKNNLSLQKIADIVEVSKTYIFDIERGNNKPPHEYRMLNRWANELKLKRKEREKFFDHAVEGQDEVPADIRNAILENDKIKKVLRKYIAGDLPSNYWDLALQDEPIDDDG
jgi:transcriptional regulator with XRE-family HTH domain